MCSPRRLPVLVRGILGAIYLGSLQFVLRSIGRRNYVQCLEWHSLGATHGALREETLAANRYLDEEYLGEHNRRFARPPAQPQDYHRRRPSARELRQIFRLESERRISNEGDPL